MVNGYARVSGKFTYLGNHIWQLLLAADDALSTNNARSRVDRTVNDVDSENMRAMRIRVLVPHPDHDVGPRMANTRQVSEKS
jgi:hypothetical protein